MSKYENEDFDQNFGSIVGIKFDVMLRVKMPHKPKIAYELVRVHSFMIHLLIAKSLSKQRLFCCVAFLSFQR